MRLSSLRPRSDQVLALLGLAIVLPAWVVVSLVAWVHRQRARLRLPRPRWPRQVFARLRSADVDPAWVLPLVCGFPVLVGARWCMVGSRFVPPLSVVLDTVLFFWFLSVPVVFCMSRKPELVQNYLADLVQDWLSRDGWNCRVVGIGPPLPSEAKPFGFDEEGVRVYRVFLEDEWGQARFGWFRLGNGRIDFDWDGYPAGEPMGSRPGQARQPAMTRTPSQPAAFAGRDPLWDRWLDGC